jgi:hypothetical protein
VSGTVKIRGGYGIRQQPQSPLRPRIRSVQNCIFCWAFKVTFANERSEVPGAMINVAPTYFVGSTVNVCEEYGIRTLYLQKSGGIFARQSPRLRGEYGIRMDPPATACVAFLVHGGDEG